RRPRQDGGVLHRDDRLVEIAVQRPGLDLAAVQLAAMQQGMERVQIVVTLRADGAQSGFQLFRAHQLGHSEILMPSSATSQPCAAASACSGEPSSSTGLVVLMWRKILRRTSRRSNSESVPAPPSMLIWPMRWPVFWLMPRRTSSSSDHRVPSKKTRSEPS